MKECPILMSAPMVRALLDGRKTQTRRALREQPPAGIESFCTYHHPKGIAHYGWDEQAKELMSWSALCPYGVPGDRLWVKETFFAWGRWETRFSAKKGRDEWHFVDQTIDSGRAYRYVATDEAPPLGLERQRAGATAWWWKRPAIFMPRAASRIDRGVTGVRVERLQDISQQDAIAEGAPPSHPSIDKVSREFGCEDFSRSWYAQLWEQINGAGTWAANPWVWVVEFTRVKP